MEEVASNAVAKQAGWGTDSSDPKPRRAFLQGAGLMVAGMMLPGLRGELYAERGGEGSAHKILVVIVGGVRRAETFSPDGLDNIPHLVHDLFPATLFYPHVRNEGVTAHFNAISSILTGNWQRGNRGRSRGTGVCAFALPVGQRRSDLWEFLCGVGGF